MMTITFTEEQLAPLVRMVVSEVIEQRDARYGNRLAFTESEAAQRIGMHPNQLAAERKAERIRYAKVGKRGIRYSRTHIDDYLNG